MPRARSLTAIDLFCGAGGLSLAFHLAGFRIALAVEKDHNAADSYKRSFVSRYSPSTNLYAEDICHSSVMKALESFGPGQIDVVIGGPPCQDFSPARLKARRKGRRASLLQHYFKIIGLLKPRVFVFENVPNLQIAARGKYWRSIKAAALRYGYQMAAHELCAEDFGVPQHRRRLFVVGVPKDAELVGMPRKRSGMPPSVMATIGHLPELAAGEGCPSDPMHRARSHRPHIVEYLQTIPEGGGWRDGARVLACHEGHSGHYDVYGRIVGKGLAPTITGGCTNPSKGRFIHPLQHRGLTVREAALLQTFPEDWEFCGGVESQSLQVGNAVPVRLGQALAKRLFRHLSASRQQISHSRECYTQWRESELSALRDSNG